MRWCLAKPSAHEWFHLLTHTFTVIILSYQAVLHTCYESRSIFVVHGRSFFFYMFCSRLTFFWPQKTTPPEIPPAVAPNPSVPVVRATLLNRMGMKIRVKYNSWIPISSYLGSSTITTPAIDSCTTVAFLHWCCDAYQHLIEHWVRVIELTWAHTLDLLKLFVRVSIIFKIFGVRFAFATVWRFRSWARGGTTRRGAT